MIVRRPAAAVSPARLHLEALEDRVQPADIQFNPRSFATGFSVLDVKSLPILVKKNDDITFAANLYGDQPASQLVIKSDHGFLRSIPPVDFAGHNPPLLTFHYTAAADDERFTAQIIGADRGSGDSESATVSITSSPAAAQLPERPPPRQGKYSPGQKQQMIADADILQTQSNRWYELAALLGIRAATTPPPADAAVGIASAAAAFRAADLAEQSHQLSILARDDPPDANYRELAVPATRPTRISSTASTGVPQSYANSAVALLTNEGQVSALELAIVTSVNRAATAEDNGDGYWADRQRAAIGGYSLQVAGLLARQPALLADFQSQAAALGITATATVQDIKDSQAMIATQGLTGYTRLKLADDGLGAGDVQQITDAFISQEPTAGAFPAALTDPAFVNSLATLAASFRGAFSPASPDLAVGGLANGTVSVLRPDASGKYTAPALTVNPFGGVATGARAATGDVDGDGTPDVVAVTGPGTPIRLAVVSGTDGATVLVPPFDPFGGDFTGGGFVAAADFVADGRDEFVVSPDQGGGPRVTVFSLSPAGTIPRANFFGIDDPAFRGGVRVATGDLNGDGVAELIVGAGFGGGPRVAVFDGTTTTRGAPPARRVGDFLAFTGTDATGLRNGVFVTAGDFDGDGKAEVAFGGGPGGGPRVFVLSGNLVSQGDVQRAQASPVANFFAADSSLRGGVRLTSKDTSGDGVADLVVGSGEGEAAAIHVYTSAAMQENPAAPEAVGASQPAGGVVLPLGVFVG